MQRARITNPRGRVKFPKWAVNRHFLVYFYLIYW